MRALVVIVAASSVVFFYGRAARDDVNVDEVSVFERMEFDTVLRGAFNVTTCFEELLTCYELTRPEMICRKDVRFETMCSAMNYYSCDETTAFKDPVNWGSLALYDTMCTDDPYDVMTR